MNFVIMTMDDVIMSKKIKFSLSKDRKLNFVIIALDSLQKEMILDSEVNADPFLTYPLLVMKVPWWMSST